MHDPKHHSVIGKMITVHRRRMRIFGLILGLWMITLTLQNYHYLRWLLLQCGSGSIHQRYETLLEKENTYRFHDILHEPAEMKLHHNKPITLLILIPSNPYSITSREKRNTIRATWGNVTEFKTTYKILFIMGKTTDSKTNDAILNEMNRHNDVIISDLIDSYDSLLQKYLSALKYTSSKFASDFVLKCDEDVYINVPRLIYLLKTKYAYTFIYGGVTHHADPVREKGKRHYIPYSDYPLSIFPPYTKGAFYVISGNLIDSFLTTSTRIKRFSLDDAYPGVVMRIHGISPTRIEEFYQGDLVTYLLPWYGAFRGGFKNVAAIGDGLTRHQMRYIDERVKAARPCS